MSTARRQAWEDSYARLENHLFWPCEEVVRFISRYVRRRIGPHQFADPPDGPAAHAPRALDLGCGIGRHLRLLNEFELEPFGIDLSATAIAKAREWLGDVAANTAVGTIADLPWDDAFFGLVVSHAVLDSVPFGLASAAVREAERVLAPGGYLYCDLIAFDERRPSDRLEIQVDTEFERGTIQSYFDEARLSELLPSGLELVERTLVTRQTPPYDAPSGRWHVVARKSG
jgi:SAM-dependent methyltransferase